MRADRSHRTFFSSLGALLLAGACDSTPDSSTPAPPPSGWPHGAEITNEYTARAEVVAIAPAERTLTVRREDGTQLELAAGENVRNFDQLAVGDALRLRYKETLVAQRRPAGEPAQRASGAIAAARARPGAKPGVGAGVALSLGVAIESIDLEHGLVVFSPASGELIARRIRTPEGREFVQGLKVGDTVQLDYAEVLVLDIEEL